MTRILPSWMTIWNTDKHKDMHNIMEIIHVHTHRLHIYTHTHIYTRTDYTCTHTQITHVHTHTDYTSTHGQIIHIYTRTDYTCTHRRIIYVHTDRLYMYTRTDAHGKTFNKALNITESGKEKERERELLGEREKESGEGGGGLRPCFHIQVCCHEIVSMLHICSGDNIQIQE